MDIRDYVKRLSLPFRGICPSCGGSNTFSATISNGVIKYYCFRASCGIKGRIDYEITVGELRDSNFSLSINGYTSSIISIRRDDTYKISEHFVSPLQSSACYSYLNAYRLLDYYSQHVDRIRYDPRQNRCVFILKNYEGECCGAVGRYLGRFISADTPRWHVYCRLQDCPFIAEVKISLQSLVLVEDCVSAINVSQAGYNCISLCGTNIPDETIKYILRYSRLYVTLDPDAASKALQLQKQLSAYRETHILTLPIDPKNLSRLQLQKYLKELQ